MVLFENLLVEERERELFGRRMGGWEKETLVIGGEGLSEEDDLAGRGRDWRCYEFLLLGIFDER